MEDKKLTEAPYPGMRPLHTFGPGDEFRALVKEREGFGKKGRPGQPYNDFSEEANCTIGYGHLIHPGPCTPEDYAKWGTIDEKTGDQLLQEDAMKAKDRLMIFARDAYVDQHMFDALLSLVYSTKLAKLTEQEEIEKGKKSPHRWNLWRHLHAGRYHDAANEFLDITDGGVSGLITRRRAEADLFLRRHGGLSSAPP